MKMNDGCRQCQLDKKLHAYPSDAAQEQIDQYQEAVREIVENSGEASAPEIASRIGAVYRSLFGPEKDFTEIKRYFNDLMMSLWTVMEDSVRHAQDPLKRAVQLAMTGNFIDFVALDHVDEDKLLQLLRDAEGIRIDEAALGAFRREIERAHRLVFFTDNCGEIVTDKLLIQTIRSMNPGIHVTVIVRGGPAANDATMEDAGQINMQETAQRVIGSGNDCSGVVFHLLSEEAAEEVRRADVFVSKGQGNYESLHGCNWNIFYILMCKCSFFVERFGVKQFTGILTREKTA